MKSNELKPYMKVITQHPYAICAIYEPHPFGSLGIADTEWCWVYYDWCGNPIGTSNEKPDGVEVDKFTADNLNCSWTTPECAQQLVDYLNKEN